MFYWFSQITAIQTVPDFRTVTQLRDFPHEIASPPPPPTVCPQPCFFSVQAYGPAYGPQPPVCVHHRYHRSPTGCWSESSQSVNTHTSSLLFLFNFACVVVALPSPSPFLWLSIPYMEPPPPGKELGRRPRKFFSTLWKS